ncbi:MFS transporter [Vibrio breoganii]|uniref:MFS transporter n=1 Tax=Vibrio breoganii TaxID=553239 RepID=UPI000C82F7CD|nr:MFS transporter [Vibrio breoganii]PMO35414.1 MFS transporter [Vibrio breoganii]
MRASIKDAPLVLLSLIFFIWGLITVSSNSLIPYYKEAFGLDYKMSMLFPMAFFITRITISLPTSFVMAKIGYKQTLQYCLIWCLLGCLAMAYLVRSEDLFLTLLGILLMASGLSAIQVVSSPYVSLLSTPDKSVLRQSIATASNSVGTVLGPLVLTGVILIASFFHISSTAHQVSALFLLIALFFLGLLIFFKRIELPDIKPKQIAGFWKGLGILVRDRSFMKLALVLMLYIGVEVSFGTFTITYLADQQYGNLGLVSATQLIASYWVFMFVGRLLFANFGSRINKDYLFSLSCLLAVVVSVFAITHNHIWVGYLMLTVGLCNSTLYPIIYAQALHAAGKQSSQGAAILIMCSIGGVILPFAQASLIDEWALSSSYIAPAIAYILMIGLYWSSAKCRSDNQGEIAPKWLKAK